VVLALLALLVALLLVFLRRSAAPRRSYRPRRRLPSPVLSVTTRGYPASLR
jgi:hypothetical protein